MKPPTPTLPERPAAAGGVAVPVKPRNAAAPLRPVLPRSSAPQQMVLDLRRR